MALLDVARALAGRGPRHALNSLGSGSRRANSRLRAGDAGRWGSRRSSRQKELEQTRLPPRGHLGYHRGVRPALDRAHSGKPGATCAAGVRAHRRAAVAEGRGRTPPRGGEPARPPQEHVLPCPPLCLPSICPAARAPARRVHAEAHVHVRAGAADVAAAAAPRSRPARSHGLGRGAQAAAACQRTARSRCRRAHRGERTSAGILRRGRAVRRRVRGPHRPR